MSEVQIEIEKMHNGSIDSILKGISSSTAILMLNAIIVGTRMELKDDIFIDAIKKGQKSEEVLLNVPIRNFAIAALAILGVEEYLGTDKVIKELIDTRFEF